MKHEQEEGQVEDSVENTGENSVENGVQDAQVDQEGVAEPIEERTPEEILEDENAELRDRLMRAMAEAENQRKRGERDRRDAEIYGGRKLARDLLSVYDNMNRALDLITEEQRANNKGLIDGIELTRRELVKTLANHKIVPVMPQIGDPFDPENHEAMYNAPVPDVAKDCIAQVLSEGFMIADKLLRPAQVGVSSGLVISDE